MSMPLEIFENPFTPEEKIINENQEGEEVERIEFNKGIFIYLKGHQYPQKGIPTPLAITAINVSKRFLREITHWWYILPFLGPKRFIKVFTGISYPILEPYILKYEFMTPTAQGIFDLLKDTDEKLAKILAHIIEYDGAYRFRLMDLATEADYYRLTTNPRKELQRLLVIHKERDYPEIISKVQKFTPLLYLLILPWYKRKFIKRLKSIDFRKLQFDEIDSYWALKKVDYKYNVHRRENNPIQ